MAASGLVLPDLSSMTLSEATYMLNMASVRLKALHCRISFVHGSHLA